MTSPALRARLTSWIETMLSPAELEEVVVDADPLEPEHLGKQPAQDVLLRGARRAPNRRRRQIRGRQRLAVELAVGRQRQLRPAPQTPPAPCSPEGSAPRCARSAAASAARSAAATT